MDHLPSISFFKYNIQHRDRKVLSPYLGDCRSVEVFHITCLRQLKFHPLDLGVLLRTTITFLLPFQLHERLCNLEAAESECPKVGVKVHVGPFDEASLKDIHLLLKQDNN